MNKYVKGLWHPIMVMRRLFMLTTKLWPDRFYLQVLHVFFYGKTMNLDNPQSYSEKCNWLKLNYRMPLFTKLVDKYEVKGYVSERIGNEHVIPSLGVWDKFDDIDFDKLPNQFCLKCTHDSGSYVICKDKTNFDKSAAKKKLEKAQSRNFYWLFREWPYKNVPPRIIAEEYIPSLGHIDSIEYKITCCDGVVKVITVCGGVPHAEFSMRSNDNFSRNWERQNWYAHYKPTGKEIEKPLFMDKLIEYSEKLSVGIPQVRVDWYVVDNNIYFGEFTFYTWGGYPVFSPQKWNYTLGSWINLPEKETGTDIKK